MTRRALYRWAGWFCAVNAGICLLVSLRYLPPWLAAGAGADSAIGTLYVASALLGHMAVLAVALPFLVLGPLIALWPNRRGVMAVAVLLAAVVLVLLVVDTNVFTERRFHLSVFTAALFGAATWVFTAIIFLVVLVFEALLAGSLARWLAGRTGPTRGPLLAGCLAGAWLLSQGLHIWGDAVGYRPVTSFTGMLPLYYPVHAKRTLARLGLLDEEAVRQARLRSQAVSNTGGDLRYPLAPLRCVPPGSRSTSVLWILVDALRPDAIDPVSTPELAKFRASAQEFTNHWSGGNSSRMGIFSMFYGLPSTYWTSFYGLQRPPVLMDEIRRQGYALMTASAVGYGSPALIDRTVFAGVEGLNPESQSAVTVKNRQVTDKWLGWLSGRPPAQPFLAFLYYDPPVLGDAGGPALPADGRYATQPEARVRWGQYRQGIRFIDGEVARVLQALDGAGLRQDTLVIIASDHGYELDDLGLGYYGHASNFGEFQLRATLLMQWPGRAAATYRHRTAHQDLPATLLSGLFACENPPSDYSTGRNLFDGIAWDWIMAGSYQDYAIVEPGRVMVSRPGGLAEVLGPDYRPAADASLDAELIERAMSEMRRFYR